MSTNNRPGTGRLCSRNAASTNWRSSGTGSVRIAVSSGTIGRTFVFVRQQSISEYPALAQAAAASDEAASEWVHVVVYDTLLRRLARLEGPLPLRRVARELPLALFRCARRLLRETTRIGTKQAHK